MEVTTINGGVPTAGPIQALEERVSNAGMRVALARPGERA